MSDEEVCHAFGVPVNLLCVSWGVKVRALTWQTMSSWISLCAQEHGHAGSGLGLFVPVKGNFNGTAYKDFLYNLCF